MLGLGLDKTWQFLVVMNVFLLVLGMVMDGFSAILVAIPLVLPFAAHFGLGPFHVAIMFVLNLELAFSCPPLGLNLFISSFRFNRPVVGLYRFVVPFVGLLAVALAVVTYAPRLSNALVLDDIAEWRAKAEKEGRAPREAWRLECVQHDNSNPLPCSPEDKRTYVNGHMPEAQDAAHDSASAPAGGGTDAAKAPPAGAGAGVGSEADDDALEALIAGKAAAPAVTDAGPNAEAVPASKRPSTEPSEDELESLITGKRNAPANEPDARDGG